MRWVPRLAIIVGLLGCLWWYAAAQAPSGTPTQPALPRGVMPDGIVLGLAKDGVPPGTVLHILRESCPEGYAEIWHEGRVMAPAQQRSVFCLKGE
jgi:hypothetical protein